MHMQLGTDPRYSEIPNDMNILSCVECGDNMFKDTRSNGCQACSTKTKRCTRCSETGEDCLACEPGYYLYSRNICASCEGSWGQGCNSCNRDHCTSCDSGFNLFLGVCFKKIF
mmetsp:Transcript_31742/g.48665  ORF Transcript_31742/g.48665 Transcript_31742/m.48665 type:complete len:113 (-) Transcript_31742:42-380(-)